MARAELKRLTVERFKSYSEPATLEIAPLTVLLGRNNSGKSSLIQALLLLKQTLAYPRSEVPLHLEGAVEAIHLRELTSGWPDAAEFVQGPKFKIVWESDVDVHEALGTNGRWPDLNHLGYHSGIEWITDSPKTVRLRTTIIVSFCEVNGSIAVDRVNLASVRVDTEKPSRNPKSRLLYDRNKELHRLWWHALYTNIEWDRADRIHVELDHFIPLISIDKRNMAGRRLLVETHSDHMVRRLRGLIARAPSGSELEKWLAANVVIAEIEQTDEGRSQLTCSRLTETGGITERWPADFMDEGTDEERSIYYAGLEKSDDPATSTSDTEFIHDPADE